ncbi:UNVERIFIED_ORG: hypothetical protein ABIB19_003255 [Arthrobacter sp. UYEF10]
MTVHPASGARHHALRVADLPARRPDPDRISFQVLVALCDIFKVEANEIPTYTTTDTRTPRRRTVVDYGTDVPLTEAYRRVRARITRPNEQ